MPRLWVFISLGGSHVQVCYHSRYKQAQNSSSAAQSLLSFRYWFFLKPLSFLPFTLLFFCLILFTLNCCMTACLLVVFSSLQSMLYTISSIAQSCPTLCNPMDCSTPGLLVHHQLLEFTQSHVHWVGDAIQPSHPLLSPFLPAINHSQHQGLFKWVSSSHQWPKYWSCSFTISPSNEYSGLISFRMDWLDLLAAGHHHSSKASVLQCSVFFMVQLSHLYMTTGKTIALTRRTLVGKVMSLLLNILSRLVTAFLPRSKCLLISWLHWPSQWFWSPSK